MSIRRLAKASLLGAAQFSGFNRLLRWANRGKLLVLCYHGIVEDTCEWDPYLYRNAIRCSEFDRQMRYLARAFHPISGHDLLSGQALPDRSVLVTFDDGFRNNLSLAAPILQKHNIPAIFHITTNSIDTGHPIWPLELDFLVMGWQSELPLPQPNGDQSPLPDSRGERMKTANRIRGECKTLENNARMEYLSVLREKADWKGSDHGQLLEFMNWDEIRQLNAQGFAIGGHTKSHPILTKIAAEQVNTELWESKDRIEQEFGATVPLACLSQRRSRRLFRCRHGQRQGGRLPGRLYNRKTACRSRLECQFLSSSSHLH